jgi:hypothetical protein
MMKVALAFACVVVLAADGASAGPVHSPEAQAKLDSLLNGRVAGETRRCIAVDKTNHPIGIDDATLLFRDGPRIWRTEISGSFNCGAIDKQSTIVTESGASRLCAGDKLVFFENGNPGGACYLGEFTPFQKP